MFSQLDALVCTGVALACRVALIAALVMVISGLAVVVSHSLPYAIVAFGVLVWGRKRARKKSESYGSAEVAQYMELEARGMIGGRGGLLLGRAGYCLRPHWLHVLFVLLNPFCRSESVVRAVLGYLMPRTREWWMIRIKSFTHLVTFAPAGTGKSVSVIIPNLRSYSGSCVVIDPKGELHKLTAWYRRWVMGHRIVRLDPFNLCKKAPPSDTFNPLDFINPSGPDLLDNCRDLANMLIVRQGTETDPHWNDAAELCLTAFITYVRARETEPEQCNMQTVRDLVSSPERFVQAINDMQADRDPVIKRLGSQLEWFKDRELNSVMTSLTRHVTWMDSPIVAANMQRSSFNPRWLKTHRTTVYFVLPHDKLITLASMMRVWLGSTLRIITKGQADESRKVLFFIDEAAHLGRIKILENAVTMLRGMGIRLWFFFQSTDQLKECFGENTKTALDNFETKQYFGTRCWETADYVSKMIGDATISIETESETGGSSYSAGGRDTGSGGGTNYSSSRTVNRSELGRRLIKPEEVLTSDAKIAFLFHDNLHVIPARLVKYFKSPSIRFGINCRSLGMVLPAALTAACLMVGLALSGGGPVVNVMPVFRSAEHAPPGMGAYGPEIGQLQPSGVTQPPSNGGTVPYRSPANLLPRDFHGLSD